MKIGALVGDVRLQISSTLNSQEMVESERMTMTTIKEQRHWLLSAVLPLFLYPGAATLHAQSRLQVLEVSTLYDGRGNDCTIRVLWSRTARSSGSIPRPLAT